MKYGKDYGFQKTQRELYELLKNKPASYIIDLYEASHNYSLDINIDEKSKDATIKVFDLYIPFVSKIESKKLIKNDSIFINQIYELLQIVVTEIFDNLHLEEYNNQQEAFEENPKIILEDVYIEMEAGILFKKSITNEYCMRYNHTDNYRYDIWINIENDNINSKKKIEIYTRYNDDKFIFEVDFHDLKIIPYIFQFIKLNIEKIIRME